MCVFFVFKQKTAYEMRISDWSSDGCSSDLRPAGLGIAAGLARIGGMAGGAGRRARITATPAAAEQDLATRRREAGKAWIGGAGLRRIIRQDRSTTGNGRQRDGPRDKTSRGADGRQHRQGFTLRNSGREGKQEKRRE